MTACVAELVIQEFAQIVLQKTLSKMVLLKTKSNNIILELVANEVLIFILITRIGLVMH